ncbi:MAG: vWA domain-containing protein [Candidatus Woesearchaeota archaeon]
MIIFSIANEKKEKLKDINDNISDSESATEKNQERNNSEGKKLLATEEEMLAESKVLNELINSGTKIDLNLLNNYIINNFSQIKDKFSSEFFKDVSGFSKEEIEKNLKYNEFKQQLQKNINNTIKKIKEDSKEIDLTLIEYLKDLDLLNLKETFGYRKGKRKSNYGEEIDTEKYKKKPFKQIDIRKTIKEAIRHTKQELTKDDLIVKELGSKKESYIYILLDCSSSMQGKKIYIAKKAAISVAYKAIKERNLIGLIGFNDDISLHIPLTTNFHDILKGIISLSPNSKTNISIALEKAVLELTNKKGIKHIILISDVLETVDYDKVYKTISLAKSENITISVIGTELNVQGKELSQYIVNFTEGKYYQFKLDQLEEIVLEDYYSFSK